jgi:Photosynthesis system II assembly factor YCF48/Putative zinc-finger
MTDLPKIAVQRLNAKGVAVGTHPDPNLISAFAENALPRGSRDRIVQHLAQCVECREVVFLSSPDQVTTLPAVASAPSRWLTWPVLRWGAAVAAVMVVGAAISLHRQPDAVSTSPGAIQMTGASSVKEKAASVPLSEEKPEMGPAVRIAPVPSTAKSNSTSDAGGKRPDQLKKRSSRVAASSMAAQNSEAAGDKVSNERRDELDKTATVKVYAGSVPVGVEADEVVPGRAKDAAAESTSNMSGQSAGFTPNSSTATEPRPQTVLPTVAPRWTLTADGTLQRSLDLGRSWQSVPVAGLTSFRALAASGKDIWVGGSKGALYHSADAGQSWSQVRPLAAGQALTDDIIGVEFPDPLHGNLTTAGKETWTTEDGGQSWVKP